MALLLFMDSKNRNQRVADGFRGLVLALDLRGATSVAKHTSTPATRQEPYYSTKNVDSSHQGVMQDQHD